MKKYSIWYIGIFFLFLSVSLLFIYNNNRKVFLASVEVEEKLERNYNQSYKDAFKDDIFRKEVLTAIYGADKVKKDFDLLSLYDIEKDLLNKIEVMDLSNKEIKELNGVEYLSNLRELNLENNQLKKVNLRYNELLTNLNISNNNLERINLNFNKNLEYLNLSKNNLSKFDTLPISKIKKLDLSNNNISEIKLTNMKDIISLRLKNNKLKEVNLKNNLKLEELDISFNKIKELSYFSNLTSLDIEATDIEDVIVNKELKRINIGSTKFKDIEFIKNLEDLEDLNVSNTNITNLDLSKYRKLKSLNISDTYLEKFNIKDNLLLQILKAEKAHIKNIDLSNNKDIEVLNLSNNKIEEIDLKELTKLKDLNLSNNKLKTINLTRFKKLNSLIVNNNELKEIDTKELKDLEVLEIANNDIEKVDLNDNLNLTKLNISSTKIKDINVDNFKKLKSLNISNLNLKEIKPFNIEEVDYSHNSISDISVFKEMLKDVKKKVLFNDQVINMLVDVTKTYDLVLKDIDGKDITLDLPEGLEYKDSKITVKKSGFFELEYQYGKIRILALKESDLKERTDLKFYTMDSLTAYYSVLNELKTLYENLKTNPSLEQGKYFATKLEELKEKEKQLKLDKDYVKNLIEEIKKSEYKDIYLDGELDNLDVFTNEADLIGKLKSLTLKKDNYTYDKLMKKLKLRNGFKAKEIENSTDTLEEKINKINDYLTSTNNITKDIETADNIIRNHGYTAFYRAQVMVRRNRVIKPANNLILNEISEKRTEELRKLSLTPVKVLNKKPLQEALEDIKSMPVTKLSKEDAKERENLIDQITLAINNINLTEEENTSLLNRYNKLMENQIKANPNTSVTSFTLIIILFIIIALYLFSKHRKKKYIS